VNGPGGASAGSVGVAIPVSGLMSSSHTMALLVDEGQVEARFSPFEDSANLDAR
jgi:hypothetical protein